MISLFVDEYFYLSFRGDIVSKSCSSKVLVDGGKKRLVASPDGLYRRKLLPRKLKIGCFLHLIAGVALSLIARFREKKPKNVRQEITDITLKEEMLNVSFIALNFALLKDLSYASP